MTRSRLLAALTALCLAWAALWPLVSAARSVLADAEMPLCHQAGQVVGMGEMPIQDGPDGEPKVHCPLCIMAFYAAFDPPPVAPPASQSGFGLTLQAHCAPVPAGTDVSLPESRAPPSLLPA